MQVVGEAKMASKDVEMTGKNDPHNSMNDKRDYEVEECVPMPSLPHACCQCVCSAWGFLEHQT